MIHRIVTMTFRENEIDAFIEVFDSSKVHIRNFPGCLGLKLLQTTNKPYQISTLSLWEDEEALDAYRNSELFQATWAKTKVLFAEKAVAFSNHAIRTLD
jgi:heme-degrading monooxygenase HmoA